MNFEQKMRDLSLLLCTLSLVAGFISCDTVKSENSSSGSLRGEKRNESEIVEIFDQPEPPVRTTTKIYKEMTKIESDNSLVETMFDAHGNKTQSRYFNGNPLLKMVVLRTKNDGQTEAVIYGQNGDIKIAPPEIVENIMNSSAKEIAKAVEIKEGTIENQIPAMLAAAKATPEPAFTLFQNPLNETPAPIVKTENVIETEMLSDKLIKSDKEINDKNKVTGEEVKPYDIPEETDQ